jgi:hypothetical protein
MLSELSELEVRSARCALLDSDKGFFVVRRAFTQVELDRYLANCNAFLKDGPTIFSRITTPGMYDYVHPRSFDSLPRTYRIYQFFPNHNVDFERSLFDRAMALREQIESLWDTDDAYRAERQRLQNYVIVTNYVPNSGLLRRHKDYRKPLKYPLMQMLVMLTMSGTDFAGGDFILHTQTGGRVSVQSDLKLLPGDILMFDKSLEHEVALVLPKEGGGRGRWSALIGARAPSHSRFEILLKRIIGSPIWNRKQMRARDRRSADAPSVSDSSSPRFRHSSWDAGAG